MTCVPTSERLTDKQPVGGPVEIPRRFPVKAIANFDSADPTSLLLATFALLVVQRDIIVVI